MAVGVCGWIEHDSEMPSDSFNNHLRVLRIFSFVSSTVSGNNENRKTSTYLLQSQNGKIEQGSNMDTEVCAPLLSNRKSTNAFSANVLICRVLIFILRSRPRPGPQQLAFQPHEQPAQRPSQQAHSP
jgi:hypothetical protein